MESHQILRLTWGIKAEWNITSATLLIVKGVIMKLTRDEQNALTFAHRYAGWHTYAQDRRTAIAISRLAIKGLVIVNQYRQFTLASQLVVN